VQRLAIVVITGLAPYIAYLEAGLAADADAANKNHTDAPSTRSSASVSTANEAVRARERLVEGKFNPDDATTNSRIKQIAKLLWSKDSGTRRGAMHAMAAMGPHALDWLTQHHAIDAG
jgi:hypothetical protein